MLKLLCVGDPHYGRKPSYLKPGSWRRYVTDMLNAALAEALRIKVDALVLMGDVFDHNNPDPLDHAEFIEFVFRCEEEGILLISEVGNHDYADSESHALKPYMRMRGRIKVIEKPLTTKMKGVPVKFFPWSPPDVKPDIGKIKDKTPYLVFAHDEVKGALMDNGWVADGFEPRAQDFVVIGHLHTHQLLPNGRGLAVGTALPTHWNHKTRGFTLLTATYENGKLNVKHEQIEYEAPFRLREVPLNKFPVGKQDAIRTYYRVHVKTGQEVPRDKRIVSIKRQTKALKVNERIASGTLDDLPDPTTWLLDHISKKHRGRARELLESVPRNKEED